MTRILDQMTVKRPLASFRPTTARELLVLRLAQKLDEPAAAQHYAELARQNSDETLLLAYRRTLNHGYPPRDPGRTFHMELAAARRQDDRPQSARLLAIKVERRCIAVARSPTRRTPAPAGFSDGASAILRLNPPPWNG